jgi:hypothetical protein
MAVALAGSLASAGCTHWGFTNVYGDRREVGRRSVGAPQVAETTSANMSADVFGIKGRDAVTGAPAAAATASGTYDSSKRTHCVQQAEIQYVQPYQIVPKEEGRWQDILGGVVVATLGLSAISGAAIASQPGAIPPGDPLYQPPPNETPLYIAGGAMLAGGIAWLVYSYWRLPAGPPPPVQTAEQKWTATEFVEAQGCGLVPGDAVIAGGAHKSEGSGAPPAKQDGDVTARLQKLDKLHKAGLLTDQEYQQKRKEVIDGL